MHAAPRPVSVACESTPAAPPHAQLRGLTPATTPLPHPARCRCSRPHRKKAHVVSRLGASRLSAARTSAGPRTCRWGCICSSAGRAVPRCVREKRDSHSTLLQTCAKKWSPLFAQLYPPPLWGRRVQARQARCGGMIVCACVSHALCCAQHPVKAHGQSVLAACPAAVSSLRTPSRAYFPRPSNTRSPAVDTHLVVLPPKPARHVQRSLPETEKLE
jgi:hypothetical protein